MLILHTAVEWWLSIRQIRSVRNHRGAVPEAFQDHLTLEVHQKAADYTIAKEQFGHKTMIYGVLLLLVWTLGGGLEWLDQLWRGVVENPLWAGVGFLLSFALIGGVLELPFSIYSTFKIEGKFGFNRTTVGTFISDLIKQTLLLAILGGGLAFVVLWLMGQAGEFWWLQVWAVWMAFSLFLFWAYPTWIAPLFNKFKPLEDIALKEQIENLLHEAGFDCDGIFVVDGSKRSSHGNAYFTGLGKKRRIVFYDTLLESLKGDEILAVLAHELGHFKHNHIKKRIALSAFVSLAALAVLAWLIDQAWFYQGLGVSTPSNHAALVLFMIVIPLFTFFLSPVMATYSRKHEFEADAFAAEKTDGEDLIHALVSMYRENAATVTPDELYSAFHDSHPPASIRIDHLRECVGKQ